MGCGPGAYRWQTPEDARSSLEAAKQAPRLSKGEVHIVKKGDTLYSIAWQYGLSFERLAEWNNIGKPYEIYPGNQLSIHSRAAVAPNASKLSPTLLKNWRWPHDGKIVKNFGAQAHQRSGVEIQTKPQDKVVAVADGEVVFAGKLNNYGLVLIVEHAQNLFSMLAYNQRLLRQTGERIKKGQVVAESGQSISGKHRLHFEIRHKAEPLNVIEKMPKRR